MKRKLLSMIVLLMTAATSAWASVVASGYCGDPSVNSGENVSWTLTDEKVLTISGTGAMADYTDYYYVPWRDVRNPITSVVIGNGVTSIGDYTFGHFQNLSTLTIGSGVTSIGKYAFYNCTELRSVSIPGNVKIIKDNAFENCAFLETLTIGSGVTTICKGAFTFCSAGLETVNIPASVTSIGDEAFSGCSALKSITVDSGNLYYDSREDCNAIIESASNTLIAGCKNSTIPNGVTSIGNAAFNYRYGLTSITIPNSVTSIGNEAFYRCSDLATITLNSNPFIGDDAFYWIKDGATVTMNLTANSADGAYWTTFYNNLYSFQADANTQVFKVELSGTALTMNKVDNRIVDYGEAVVLKKTTDGNIVMTLTTTASGDTQGNSLSGVYNPDGVTADGNMYVLNNGSKGVGFYKLTSGKKLGVGKAYLTYIPGVNGAPEFFGFEETTGIEDNNRETITNNRYYDLQGRKVAQPTKGLYIVNGKKVIIK